MTTDVGAIYRTTDGAKLESDGAGSGRCNFVTLLFPMANIAFPLRATFTHLEGQNA